MKIKDHCMSNGDKRYICMSIVVVVVVVVVVFVVVVITVILYF